LQEETTQQAPPVVPPTAPPAPNFLLWPTLTLARFARNAHGLNDGAGQRPARNHLFRFDGNRYSSWLPSFSIEINHNFPFRLGRARLTGVQLTGMAQHVQQVFPQIPYEIILADLQRTQSIDLTIENIIEHRIRVEPAPVGHQHDTSASEDTSYTSSEASSSDAGEPIDPDPL
jgi:autocrine motility factor receptor